MENTAVHMRITGLTISNEDVDSRKKAISDIASNWKKSSNASSLVARANDICIALSSDGMPPPSLSSEIEMAIQKHASAFLAEESPLEVGICAGMAMVSVMNTRAVATGLSISEIYSNALWSGLSFQPALEESKREKLRSEVLTIAKGKSQASADAGRQREEVPDPEELTITTESESTNSNLKKVIKNTIDTLRRNAALDREELDFLWWSQLGHSRLLKRPLTEIQEPVRLLAMALEAAGLLRRFPANVHHELVLRTIDKDPELTLTELIEAVGEDRDALSDFINVSEVTRSPYIYPLLSALASPETCMVENGRKLKSSEWASRALVEAGLALMVDNGVGKL